jgi:hypothetical protein
MSVYLAALLLQYVISVKAGLVNHVQGAANVAEMETARVGHPIRTGADGYVEILLRPGSFLRLGENSEATIDDADLANVKLTVTKGPALIEVVENSKDHPISVTTKNLTMNVIGNGIYKFDNGTATVIQGKLETGDSRLTYEKGWQIFYQDNYRARKLAKITETSLDIYSQTRSGTIASANFTLANTLRGSNANYGDFDIWLYSPYLRFYTFIPRSDYRSPYGYRYYGAVGNRIVQQYVNNNSSSDNSGGSNRQAPATDNSNSSSTAVAAPPPTAATPSGERTAPSVYIDSKSSPVGATTR